jgi:ATP-dependent DNA ligase
VLTRDDTERAQPVLADLEWRFYGLTNKLREVFRYDSITKQTEIPPHAAPKKLHLIPVVKDHRRFAVFQKISPIVPLRCRDLFESVEWVYELKHDGFRALTYFGEGRCRFVSRRGNEMKRFANVAVCVAK